MYCGYWHDESDMMTLQYTKKSIKEWDSEECSQWAADTERQLNIPISSCLTLGNFANVTGRVLRSYKEEDFKRLVGSDRYGPLFYKAFKKLIKKEKEEAASSKIYETNGYEQMDTYTNFTDTSNWTVPEGRYELEVPSNDYGLYQGSSPCISPLPSPSFHLKPKESPMYTREENNLTIFTQPAMLSGGSLMYGASNSSMSSFDDSCSAQYCNNDQNYSHQDAFNNIEDGSSTILPNFKMLGIDDEKDPWSNNLDISQLESSFNSETFRDLDQYVHDGSVADFLFDDGSNTVPLPDQGLSAALAISSNDPLEESMLKKIPTGKRGNRVRHPTSWEFLIRLLLNPQTNPSLIKWEDKEKGTFRLVQKDEIAKLWGKRSQKHKSNPLAYDNFARIIRYHYGSKILEPVSEKHLVYKFGEKVMSMIRNSETRY